MFATKLKTLRLTAKMNQSDLAEILHVERSTVSRWESGTSMPAVSMIERIAEVFDVRIDYLMGKEVVVETAKIPVIGKVQAGLPVEAVEEILAYEYIPAEMAESGEFFGLMVKGDSMSPRMIEGDTVIVRRQSDIRSGDVAVVLVGNEDATVKKVIKHEDGITLIAFNPAYPPRFFTLREVINTPVEILGKVVELRGKF
ncbi:MAG: helix-turn-helix domain-containing protein [Eubacteriaceae bacterium]|nr:helix-turn-helix domain-containing protein [Eubacteriaceae bacterium]